MNLNLNLKWYFALLCILEARLEFIGTVAYKTEFVIESPIKKTMKT